ncbi:chemotaxis protein CheA [Paraferrimonas sedimenticola]|uniref:Chemotaxis protein CheA n=1 Tax=Paraferrimonas sedimenticola TaxID=375674 RepID=A0AA37RNS6_9GAMM|nr:chemotaxis protein CheA [Paraferrimonas sedimenticola]GLP94955.1 chemotaxis protein CheA [Paraferrimonas sedimenticola]
MALDLDQEILQDFLLEAGEILEQLSSQLVELENSPDDQELLNAIFRGFHTIKGGAGFLSLTEMVNVCHGAENLFDQLRNGVAQVTPELMDLILEVTDSVNSMFAQLQAGQPLQSAPQQLLNAIDQVNQQLSDGQPIAPNAAPVSTPAEPATTTQVNDILQDEFDDLLNALEGESKPAEPAVVEIPEAAANTSDDISDDEFEALLDQLHGEGQFSAPATESTSEPHNAAENAPAASESKPKAKQEPVIAKPQAETTVRVDTARLDTIMNMVGELVLVRNRLLSLGVSRSDEAMSKALANLDLVTADLQGAVMKTRMQPIKKVFGRFPRVVRDLARSLNKEVKLELIGEDTDLDKNLVEALADPLVHLVRNAVDHGIETPEQRQAAGKPSCGQISLSASQEGDHILLQIRDDGAGMDPEKLKALAIKRGVLEPDAAERMSDSEAFNLIFAAGFSTKQEVSDVSGRGVGMDVVKTSITQLNGTVDIQSEMGVGTHLEIKVPLTLAIMPTLMVKVAQQIFALPLSNVSEIIVLEQGKTNMVDGQRTLIVRDKAIPLFYLDEWLKDIHGELPETQESDSRHVVIVQIANRLIGFVVDGLIGQEEVVIKPLGELLQGTPGMSGATITSDGGIALILDVPGLLKHYAGAS